MTYPNSSPRPRKLIIATLVSMSLLAGTVAPVTAHADIGDLIASLFFSSGRRMTVEMDSPAGQLKMKISGQATFTDAEDDMASLTDKAYIQQKRDGHVLRMNFEADGVGGIKRTYLVDGRVMPQGLESKRWMAEVVPTLFRETAMDSAKRIRRIHGKGGADAVLAEIDRIKADYARRVYLEGLAQLGPLSENQLHQMLASVADIDSDFERRSAFSVITRTQPLNASHQVAVLKTVTKMTSSFEQRGVLAALMPKLASDADVMRAWVLAVADIDSDFEMRSAIDALVKRDPTPLQIDAALQATMHLDSSFEHASALTGLAKLLGNATPAQVNAYLNSARKIDSDFERRTALVALLNRAKLDKAGYIDVLNAVSSMQSDFEMRTVLMAVAQKMPADGELVASYRRTARRLGDFERGQAEKALDHLNL
ncbi:MAG: hypothetical protein ABI905_16010 [Betaproteobacteria bacterium]